jgi:hypothetical protein
MSPSQYVYINFTALYFLNLTVITLYFKSKLNFLTIRIVLVLIYFIYYFIDNTHL